MARRATMMLWLLLLAGCDRVVDRYGCGGHDVISDHDPTCTGRSKLE